MRTFPTYNEGEHVYVRDGLRLTYPKDVPLPPDPFVAEAVEAIVKLNEGASQVPPDAPWRASNAGEWDSKTMQTWIDENMQTPGGRFLVTLAVRAILSLEPRDPSLLFLLFYIASAGNEQNPGNIERLISTQGGAQERRFVGGAQQICTELADSLGSRVMLDTPVRRIVQEGGDVHVEADGLTAVGERVIVAVPPTVAGRIEYSPRMPASRDQLTQRYPMGSVIKANAVYDKPFWRDAGLTGQALGDPQPIQVTFDNSPPDESRGVLMGFIEADQARTLVEAPEAERRRQVLANFATYFGDQALSPRQYVDYAWDSDPWRVGCPVGFGPPGVLLEFGDTLRAPVRRIHWAGTETSVFWNGYLDGAVRSGERAAAEVLPLLPSRRRRTPSGPSSGSNGSGSNGGGSTGGRTRRSPSLTG